MNAIIEIGVNGLEAFLVYQLLKSTIPDCQKRKFQKWGIIGIAFLVSIFNLIKLDSSIQVVCVLLVHMRLWLLEGIEQRRSCGEAATC